MKYILNQISDVRYQIRDLPDYEARAKLVEAVNDFVMAGSYTKCRKIDKLFSTHGMSQEKQALAIGVSVTNLRRIKSEVTQAALKALGDDIFEVIVSGTIKELRSATYRLKYGLADVNLTEQFGVSFCEMVVSLVDDEERDKEYDVGDCKPEVALLYWMSSMRYRKLISEVDPSRLNYLLRCLSKKTGTSDDRATIMRIIEDDDIFSHLQERDKSTFRFPPVRKDEDF